MYTLEDLAQAEAEFKRWDDAFANDSSNNPNKYEAQRRDARSKVRLITEHLKLSEIIEKTDAEKLNDELDRLYPMPPLSPSFSITVASIRFATSRSFKAAPERPLRSRGTNGLQLEPSADDSQQTRKGYGHICHSRGREGRRGSNE